MGTEGLKELCCVVTGIWKDQHKLTENIYNILLDRHFVCVCVCVCVLFRAAPVASEGSQARGPTGATAQSTPQSQQHRILAASATYTTAHGNARSLAH